MKGSSRANEKTILCHYKIDFIIKLPKQHIIVRTGSRHLSPTPTSSIFPNLGSTDKSTRRKPTSVT